MMLLIHSPDAFERKNVSSQSSAANEHVSLLCSLLTPCFLLLKLEIFRRQVTLMHMELEAIEEIMAIAKDPGRHLETTSINTLV